MNGTLRRFLAKPLPRNVSWLHTLGSLLLLYLAFEFTTGLLLGLYYSPSPDGAYRSLRYVREELFLGELLHRLHRYGAGFLMVTVFLHLARSYFLAAYKRPRELLWLSGLALAVLLSLFAFTGQLLPYDQRGYWATVVGIRIASSAPGLVEPTRALLTGGYDGIGAATLSRFYIVHVALLPLALVGLAALHLAILQRTGSAGPANGGSPEPTRPFYPLQAFKDVLVSALGALALVLTATLVSPTETGPVNPSIDFTPRPEWYFLAHYEILRLLPGRWQVLGTFVLPNAVLVLLAALPFLDRGPERSLRRRRFGVGIGLLGCVLLIGLTIQGVVSAPAGDPELTLAGGESPAAFGERLFREKRCVKCHRIDDSGGTTGPELDRVGTRLRPDYMEAWIRNPHSFVPTTEMPAFEGSEAELSALLDYLSTLKNK